MNLIEAVGNDNTIYTPAEIERATAFVQRFKGDPSEKSATFVRKWHKKHGVRR